MVNKLDDVHTVLCKVCHFYYPASPEPSSFILVPMCVPKHAPIFEPRLASLAYFVDVTFPRSVAIFPYVAFRLDWIGNGTGSAGSSPLHLPMAEDGDDDDELYRDMAS